MDHRGHYWPDSGRHSHRKDGEGFSRSSQQERDQAYPPPDLRDRHWGHFPPPRAEQYPYGSQQYQYGYGPEHQRPLSRHGYEYPPHSHWDYSYGYYDYHRGQHGRQGGGWWGPQGSWRADRYHEHPGAEAHRFVQVRDGSQHLLNDQQDFPSRDNDEVSSYYLGTLESSKASGLSSSSYELSQYMNGADHGDPAPQPDGARVHQMPAPLKYSVPHALVSFGPAGQLIRVATGVSTQENVSHLEIHSLEVILSETQEQQDMRSFPGPFTREDLHKVDAIEFAQQMAGACMRDTKLQDGSCAALLWNILILLCRQNGQIVGSDIAELLMQDSHSDGSCPSDAPTLIDFNEDTTAEAAPCEGDDLLTGNGSSFSPESSEKALHTYTQLLLAGRKKEALESAMSGGLWGHALFLASKMDNRSYTTVLNRFTGQLRPRDPLQTLFQLLSGRIPAVATCCGNEKWGDWRPHLAVLLSNETGDPAIQQKAIVTMGDTLASRGLIHAAHVCYLTAGVPFGAFTQKAERLVLLGSSHRKSFECFATNAAIRCTEVYEYSQTLGGKNVSVPSFQVYKLLYAGRLLDCGLPSQAFHYCEVVGQAILRQQEPFFVLTGEVIKLSDRLRYSEGQFSEAGLHGAGQEPEWLKHLRARHHSLQTGTFGCTETHQNSVAPHQVPSELDLDDLSISQSPEPELLYYRGPEDPEGCVHQGGGDTGETAATPWGSGAAQDRTPLTPATVAYTPPLPTVAPSHNFSYHNTDSAEVISVSHCPPNNLAGRAEGAEGSRGAGMADGPKPEGSLSQQIIPEGAAEGTAEPPEQNTKKGWFSGWFTSRPKEVPKDTSEWGGPAQTELSPSAGLRPPPPPAAAPPGMFPPPSSSAGTNPFSRKAGQQLG